MRRLVVCNIISLDGFYEGPGKNVMALPFDAAFDEVDAYNGESHALPPAVIPAAQ